MSIRTEAYDAIVAQCLDAKLRAERAEARLAEAEADCLEQARLNGMGSEREARLMARLAEYEAKDGQRTREHNILVRENREQAARLAEAERLLRWADAMVKDFPETYIIEVEKFLRAADSEDKP